MAERYEHHTADGKADVAANYSLVSMLAHWLGAVAIVVLFLTHDGDWLVWHVSLGLVLTIPLIWRVIRRWSLGFPRVHDQPIVLNFLARLTMIGFLLSIVIVTLTGLLMPLFEGTPYPFFNIAEWTAPFGGSPVVYDALEEAHDIAGHAFVPLLALHVIGFLKHRFFDKSANNLRMLKPMRGGK